MKLNKRGQIHDEAANPKEHLHGLRDLFADELRTAHFSEMWQAMNLPKLIALTSNLELRETLYAHIEDTKNHIRRFESIFHMLHFEMEATQCDGLINLVNDVSISQIQNIFTRDAAIVSAVQKIEHYEIASYGTLLSYARTLSEHDAASLLQDSLNEEKNLNVGLTELAVMINVNALSVDFEFGT